jgi:hypothetical protein
VQRAFVFDIVDWQPSERFSVVATCRHIQRPCWRELGSAPVIPAQAFVIGDSSVRAAVAKHGLDLAAANQKGITVVRLTGYDALL